MTGRELYEIWAPVQDEWSPWVKPVLFAEIDEQKEPLPPSEVQYESGLRCGIGTRRDTAIVVDLAGVRSLAAGFDLARDGYRPVPLYNTTSGRRQGVSSEKCVLTDVSALVKMLSVAPPESVRNAIAGDNPPAFLLDSRRLQGQNKPAPGVYDNRWMVFPQDFPSARFLASRGISQVIVIQDALLAAQDLVHVLLRWKEGGIAIHVQNPQEDFSLRPAELRRPPSFRSLLYRILATMSLRRNSAGGFGSVLPLPTQSSGGFGRGGFG
ncbi:MAG TPA: hypothetical protein PLT20_08575 [Sedimentisphaerales bacterium]|nr:hypothetical protein [Sedimentisphaerales bacterium]HQI28128.1 hypothetical protein [Sedimentisphaerales bacterium]